jgi:predicted GNAT family acetyltransferase
MPTSDSTVRVVDNPDRNRFEAYVGDELAGYVTYRVRPGVVVLVHTEVGSDFEGHGVGGHLASTALEQIRARGLKVEPLCPFIAHYLERHPELADLVARAE